MAQPEFGSWLSSPTTGFVLKLFASLAAAAFGLLGIGTTTRDDGGKLTRRGWIAFSGIIVAAFLGIGSCIYDFVSTQELERANKVRAQQLLTSVRRGIFPMRGMKVSAEFLMAGEVAPIKAFKAKLRDMATQDRNCEKTPIVFHCNGFGATLPQLYEVRRESILFPQKGSDLRRLLDFVYVHVSILKEASFDAPGGASKGPRKPQYLGRFFVNWDKDGVPGGTLLSYDYVHDTLALKIYDAMVSDSEVITSGVYSLVDFMPGYMRLIPSLSEGPMCEGHSKSGICSAPVVLGFSKGLSLSNVVVSFPYPKQIRAYYSAATVCVAEPGNGISTGMAIELPVDVEGLDSLGNIVSPLPMPTNKKSICELTYARNEVPKPTAASAPVR